MGKTRAECSQNAYTSAFLGHWIQILANSSPKSDIKKKKKKKTRFLFFRILRSVGRGQHNNFGGGGGGLIGNCQGQYFSILIALPNNEIAQNLKLQDGILAKCDQWWPFFKRPKLFCCCGVPTANNLPRRLTFLLPILIIYIISQVCFM